MKEIVVISGKGGTGKTSFAASFAALAGDAVMADCDVDAANLHLLFDSKIIEREDFYSGHEAVIRPASCIDCGVCVDYCRYGAIIEVNKNADTAAFAVDPLACEGCGLCVRFCPTSAIDFPDRYCGELMLSETPFGFMSHARLGVAAENSGKLATAVRRKARAVAERNRASRIIVDGPPGIGCAAIASLTGADMALAVTEPTLSGEHDLERILSLTRHFSLSTAVCVNKWDLNPTIAERIETKARAMGAHVVGRVRYDPAITQAQLRSLTIVETNAPSAQDICAVWRSINVGMY